MYAATLWKQNRDLAQACLDHPFVRGLGDGTLPQGAFKHYVAQDAFFLRAFSKAYALALAKCDDAAASTQLYRFLGGAFEELELHAAYARELAIDLTNVQPLPAAAAYTDFLQATAWRAPVGETLAAMAPCMRLYAFLGTQLAERPVPDNPYQAWIDTYSAADFGDLADGVDTLLARLATGTVAERGAYRYAMQCELDFFSAPLELT